jgi:hypothetical protein
MLLHSPGGCHGACAGVSERFIIGSNGRIWRKESQESISGKGTDKAAMFINVLHKRVENRLDNGRQYFRPMLIVLQQSISQARKTRDVEEKSSSRESAVYIPARQILQNEMWNQMMH